MADPIIPHALGAKIADFLAAKKTGQIVFNVNQGRIESYTVQEYGRLAQAQN